MATVKGTAKVDSFTVNASSVIVVTGKKSSTKKISKNGKNRIYGAAAKDTFTIKGGKLNYIYGDAGNDTITVTSKIGSGNRIYGDDAKDKVSGNDTFNINSGSKNYFYGGKGTDTFNVNGGSTNYIYGGEGNDVIVIGKTSTGTAVVKDFSVKSGNTDKIKVNGGMVKGITLSGKNLIVKGGKSASITLENAVGKTISLQDSRGSYTASKTEIKLGSSFTGTMDATKYLSTVTKIDGRNATKRVNITGNAQDNIIYAGKSGGTIKGGAGDDTLYGGTGADTFVHNSGNDTIYNYVSGSDTIKLATTTLTNSALSGNDAVLNLTNGESITVKNAVDRNIVLIDSAGTSQTVKVPIGGTNTGGNTGGGTGTSKTANEIVITKGGTYKATSKTDLFNIQTNDTITITNIASNDIIKVLNYNTYSMKQIGNDLIINNSVIVKDYYKLSGSIKFGDKALTLIPGTDGKSVLTATSGNDIIFGNTATKSVYAYDGNDEIIAGHNQIVFAGNGNDTILSNEPGTNVLYGGNGNDSINVSSSGKNYMYGGNDDDTIVVSGSGSYYMYGGEGNDTLKATSISGSYYMYGGNGKDTYIPYLGNIYSTSYSGGSIIIENAETTFTDEEFANLEDEEGNGYNSYKNINSDREDTLVISNYRIDDFTFKLDKFDLIISSKYDVYSTNSKAYANELIRIKDWYVHPLENIQFKDKTYTADEINNYMASTYYHWVDGTKNYTAKGDKIRDVFLVDPSLKSADIIISDFGKSDILDLSFSNGYEYMAKSGNDLRIITNYKYLEDKPSSAITIKNFFKNTNQDNYILTSSTKRELIEAYNMNVQARATDSTYYINRFGEFCYAGDGNDTINISLYHGMPNDIYGEGGNDIISVEDWRSSGDEKYSDLYLNGGTGNDQYIMYYLSYGSGFFDTANVVYIDELGKTSNEIDTLEIRYRESKDYKFSLDDSSNLIIAEKNYEDSHVCYHILGGNVLDSIYFTEDNVTYTKEDIARMINKSSVSSAMLSFSNSPVSSSAYVGNDLFQQNNSSNIIVTGNV